MTLTAIAASRHDGAIDCFVHNSLNEYVGHLSQHGQA